MTLLVAALSGALFGTGLLVSGMTDPARVRGFLDLFGHWDPTLAFVMAGAVGVMGLAWRLAARRRVALAGRTRPDISAGWRDPRLLIGSAIFGAGWGLAGYCPGPAVASALTAGAPIVVFIAAMLAGMLLARRIG